MIRRCEYCGKTYIVSRVISYQHEHVDKLNLCPKCEKMMQELKAEAYGKRVEPMEEGKKNEKCSY